MSYRVSYAVERTFATAAAAIAVYSELASLAPSADTNVTRLDLTQWERGLANHYGNLAGLAAGQMDGRRFIPHDDNPAVGADPDLPAPPPPPEPAKRQRKPKVEPTTTAPGTEASTEPASLPGPDGDPGYDPDQAEPPAEPPETTRPAVEAETISAQWVKDRVAQILAGHPDGRPRVRAMVTEFGGESVLTIPAEQRTPFLLALNKEFNHG